MPVVPTQEIVQRAFAERYGVAAFNVVNDLTMEAVLAAAEELRAPLIVQTSVKTVKSVGADVLVAMWTEMTRDLRVPVETWMQNATHIFSVDAGGPVSEVVIDPDRRLPDRDRGNNAMRPK